MRAGTGRTLVGFALLVAALLAVVALASRGHLGPDATRGGGVRASAPEGVFTYLYAVFLVAGIVALPIFFSIYTSEVPYSRKRRRRARLLPFALLAAVAVALLVAARYGDALEEALGRLELWRAGGGDGADAARAPRPPGVEWVPLAVVSSVVAVGGGLLGWRTLARRRRSAPGELAEQLSLVLDATLDDLRHEPDARRAIIVAYARLEETLCACGVERHRHEAPLEYLGRVLAELHVTPGPVASLTHLFERAKFSHHAIDGAMKAEAIEALEHVRRELRGARPKSGHGG